MIPRTPPTWSPSSSRTSPSRTWSPGVRETLEVAVPRADLVVVSEDGGDPAETLREREPDRAHVTRSAPSREAGNGVEIAREENARSLGGRDLTPHAKLEQPFGERFAEESRGRRAVRRLERLEIRSSDDRLERFGKGIDVRPEDRNADLLDLAAARGIPRRKLVQRLGFDGQDSHSQLSTRTSLPKIAWLEIQPFVPPRLFSIRKRSPSIALTRWRYSEPFTRQRTIEPTSSLLESTGSTVHRCPDSIFPVMELPRGRNATVSPR